MAYCELCDLERVYCEHGRQDRKEEESAVVQELWISRTNMAHFPRCPHKEGDSDYSGWATLNTPGAWQRLANGEKLPATGGARPDRIATTRRLRCIDHGPW